MKYLHARPVIDWFPLWLSLRVAAISTAIALADRAVAGMDSGEPVVSRQKKFWTPPITLPLVLPPTVLGYYLLVLLGRASPSAIFMNGSSVDRWSSPGRRPWWRRYFIPRRCW